MRHCECFYVIMKNGRVTDSVKSCQYIPYIFYHQLLLILLHEKANELRKSIKIQESIYL